MSKIYCCGDHAGLSWITAAVIGVILNLAIWFAIHTVFRDIRPIVFGPIRVNAPMLASIDLTAPVDGGHLGHAPLQPRYDPVAGCNVYRRDRPLPRRNSFHEWPVEQWQIASYREAVPGTGSNVALDLPGLRHPNPLTANA